MLHEMLLAIFSVRQIGLHFLVLFPILGMLLEWLIRWVKPEIMPVLGL